MSKFRVVLAIVAFMCSATFVNAQKKSKPVKLETRMDTVSYAIGNLFGTSLKSYGISEVNIAALNEAFLKAIKGDTTVAFTPEKSNEIIGQFVTEIRKKKAEKNLTEGTAFLAKNKTQPGVVELPSGLQYVVLTEGAGESPKAENKVKVHYKGTLLDGKQFDSSYDRGEPVQFGVGDVIEGWQEALKLMKPGAKWKLFIPANLGYGENAPQGSIIEPNMVLVFEVELISFE